MSVLCFVFNADLCSFWVSLQPRRVVLMGSILECVLYVRIFISSLVNIYRHLLILSIILYSLWSYLIFSLLPVNSVLLSQYIAKVWSTGELLLLPDITANHLAKAAHSFTSKVLPNWQLFQFYKQLFNHFNQLL